ncbi:MAG: response regulator [Bacteroidales bacterium]|nr:response regulator [Bacteroidales bacterium]
MDNLTRVLYVDDEPINLLLFEQMFKRRYNVITAESGFKGLDTLQQNNNIEVVISDMKMPGMTGLDFIQKVHGLFPNIILYLFSGYDITPEIQESLEKGIILEYFQKPFNMQIIDEAISKALNNR